MNEDRGLAALTTVIRYIGSVYDSNGDRMTTSVAAAAILGERSVFWPDGTDEYREAIRQHQVEIEWLRAALVRFMNAWNIWIATQPGDRKKFDWDRPKHELNAAIEQVHAVFTPVKETTDERVD